MMKQVRLAVCVPSLGSWDEQFGLMLAKLLMFCSAHPFPGFEAPRAVSLYQKRGSLISKLREDFFTDCRANGDTHALLLDCDQTFPPDTAHRLLAHGKAVVAANVATKNIPAAPTARMKDGTPYGYPCLTANKSGLEPVWRLGCAVMLVDIAGIERLGRGLFEVWWDDSIGEYRGEDWSFCKKCEDHGVPVYVDHDLSRQIGHIGQYIFTHRDVPRIEQEKAA